MRAEETVVVAYTLPSAFVARRELARLVIANFEVVALVKVTLPLNVLAPEKVLVSERSVEEAELEERHVPLMEKHPVVMLKPTLLVEVAEPFTLRPESVVVPLPELETERKSSPVVPPLAVEEETLNIVVLVSPYRLKTESVEVGVVVPIPTRSAKSVLKVAVLARRLVVEARPET